MGYGVLNTKLYVGLLSLALLIDVPDVICLLNCMEWKYCAVEN